MKNWTLALMGSVLLCGGQLGAVAELPVIQQVADISWKTFHSAPGKCSVAFPKEPEHVHQLLPMTEDGYDLAYDVYVSPHQNKAVYMVLIAQYPPFVDHNYSEQSLESFLNGILSQNPNNRLIFADLTDHQGHKALDFFIQTKGVYFKGRAIMAKNNLYLVAMECETQNYAEVEFNYFISSFKIHTN